MKLIKTQRGITLVELLIALGVGALITGTLGTAIFQILDRSARGQEALTALYDIQNAGRWLYLDGERAESTDLVDAAPPVNSITLGWTDDGAAHTVTYYLSGTALLRDHDGTVTTVARYVSSADFSISDRLVTINLTSTPEGDGQGKDVTYHFGLH